MEVGSQHTFAIDHPISLRPPSFTQPPVELTGGRGRRGAPESDSSDSGAVGIILLCRQTSQLFPRPYLTLFSAKMSEEEREDSEFQTLPPWRKEKPEKTLPPPPLPATKPRKQEEIPLPPVPRPVGKSRKQGIEMNDLDYDLEAVIDRYVEVEFAKPGNTKTKGQLRDAFVQKSYMFRRGKQSGISIERSQATKRSLVDGRTSEGRAAKKARLEDKEEKQVEGAEVEEAEVKDWIDDGQEEEEEVSTPPEADPKHGNRDISDYFEIATKSPKSFETMLIEIEEESRPCKTCPGCRIPRYWKKESQGRPDISLPWVLLI